MTTLLKFFGKYSKFILPTLLIIFSLWTAKGLFTYNVYSAHDFDHHISRSYDAIASLDEGHFPLRWAGSLNFGCGVAIFNFFYPLIYYLVIFLNSFLDKVVFSFKLINLGSLVFGTIFFYLWVREETGDRVSSFVGALLYLFAPYRFSLVYVRSSPEFLAYAIFPLVAFLFSRTLKVRGRRLALFGFGAAISGALLAISHNFAALFLFPIIFVFIIVKTFIDKINKTNLLVSIGAFVSSFGLASFFIGPALLEQKFVKLGQVNVVDFHDHFPTLAQLIKSPWGYFYSNPGINDGMSFMLGYAHWLVLGLSVLFLIYKSFLKNRGFGNLLKNNLWIILLALGSLITIFLMLPVSTPVWENLSLLSKVQFPWRLLGIAVLFISALSAFLLVKLRSTRLFWPIVILICFLAIYGNRNHLLPFPIHPDLLYLYDHYEKLHFNRYTTTTLGDDILASSAPDACYYSTQKVQLENGEIPVHEIIEKKNTTGAIKFLLNENQLDKKIIFGLSYFPGAYEFNINGIDTKKYDDCSGLVCLRSEALRDTNYVSWQIIQTPIQKVFNSISVLFFAIWIVVITFSVLKIKPTKKIVLSTTTWLILFSIFIFLRSYNIEKRIIFNWDQERDVRAVSEILSGDIKLIGPRALGPEGFYLPPYFYYMLLPFYAFTNSPNAMIYFLIFYNLAFFIISFLTLRKIFNINFTFVFLLLWGVNSHTIAMDTIVWNPLVIPFLSIALLYLLYLYWKSRKNFLLFSIGFLVGLGISSHVQFVLLSPLIIPFIFNASDLRFGRIKTLLKRLTFILLGLGLSFVPLIIFDVKNNFLNVNLILSFIQNSSQPNPTVFLSKLDNFFMNLTALSIPNIGTIVLVLLFAILILFLKIFSKKSFEKLVSLGFLLVILFTPIAFALYGKAPSEYYFNYLAFLTFFTISLAFCVVQAKYKILAYILVIVLAVYSLSLAYSQLKEQKLSFYYKNKTAEFLSNVTRNENIKFNLSFDVPFNDDSGFRYLLEYHKVKPTGDPRDTLIEIVIPPSKKDGSYPVGGVGVYLPEGFLNQIGLKTVK